MWEICRHLSDGLDSSVGNKHTFSDRGSPTMDFNSRIQKRISAQARFGVWTPTYFMDIGLRDALDQALSRMTSAGGNRRITCHLYDLPPPNSLTGKPASHERCRVSDGLVQQDHARMLLYGLTAANDLGPTDVALPKISIHTGARLRPIKSGAQIITLKLTAPSRLYWAGHPAMRVVRAMPRWIAAPPSSARRSAWARQSRKSKKNSGSVALSMHGRWLMDAQRRSRIPVKRAPLCRVRKQLGLDTDPEARRWPDRHTGLLNRKAAIGGDHLVLGAHG